MTSPARPTGTDRIAGSQDRRRDRRRHPGRRTADQGTVIDAAVDALIADPPCRYRGGHQRSGALDDPNRVKVVMDS
jgi:hypothetical protein